MEILIGIALALLITVPTIRHLSRELQKKEEREDRDM